jgi:DNA-directed RNA polymerase subunit RPC12/RpoP
MRGWLKALLVGVGIIFLFNSAIFVVAGLSPPPDYFALFTGLILFVIGALPIVSVVLVSRSDNKKAKIATQTIRIDGKDLVGGEKDMKDLECMGCSAPLSTGDIKYTDVGIVVNCPYCGKTYTMHEKPLW